MKAQDYQVSVKFWDVKDGLSDRQVNGIYKDSRGFIWACTKNGLNCFDGFSFKGYSVEKDGLPFRYLWRMTEDADGVFWIIGSPRYDSINLFIFDPLTKKVTSFYEKTGYKGATKIEFLQRLSDSTLFFAERNQQFFFTWKPKSGLRKIPYPVAYEKILTTTRDNTFWLLTKAGEMCEINMQGRLLRTVKTDHISYSGEQDISNYHISRLIPGTKNSYELDRKVIVEDGKAVLVNDNDSLYSTVFNTGVDSVMFESGKLVHPHKGLLFDLINNGYHNLRSLLPQVLIDHNGIIWVASIYGIYQVTLSKNKFRKYFCNDPNTFFQNSYRRMVVDNGTLFAFNEFQGLKFTPVNSSEKNNTIDTIPFMEGYAVSKTQEGDIMGISTHKLFSLKKNSRKWSILLIDSTSRYNCWKIYRVAKDSFLLGIGAGLQWLHINPMKFSFFTKYGKYNELKKATVLDILPDRNGHEWLCSNKGFYEYDAADGVIGRYSAYDTGIHFLPAREFQHYYQDRDGIYWLATTSGLIKWDKAHNQYRLFSRADGLSNNNIYAVYPDDFGNLWLSSDFGLMKFNKATGMVKTYLTDDGITHNEFNRVSHTSDSSGNLYFGTLNGVTSFDPKDFVSDSTDEDNATLAISSFEQFNGETNKLEDKTASLVHTRTITLKPGDRFFTISFALLTFSDAIHTTYYWKIDGIDSAWTSMREPVLRVSGLPYGKMLLHIKAQANDGSWGKNELQFQINVIKPFYLRTGFIILCVFMLLWCIIIIYRLRVVSLKRENEKLDKIVKEKTSALEATINDLELSSRQKDVLMKEIHHRVKNNLQVISTLLNLQLKNIKDDAAKISIEEGISRISSIALIHHHLYESESLTSIEMRGFTGELLKQVASVYLKPGQDIDLRNNIPDTKLDIDTALPLGLILNELMTNSFKYAYNNVMHCKMEVSLTRGINDYTLRFCDDGPGLADGLNIEQAPGLGMTIIKNLSKQLGGSFWYQKSSNCFMVTFKDTVTRKNTA